MPSAVDPALNLLLLLMAAMLGFPSFAYVLRDKEERQDSLRSVGTMLGNTTFIGSIGLSAARFGWGSAVLLVILSIIVGRVLLEETRDRALTPLLPWISALSFFAYVARASARASL